MSKENYFSEAALRDNPLKKIRLKLRDGSVTKEKIADGAVTIEKLSDGIIDDIASQITPGTGTGESVRPLTENDIDDIINGKYE